ncbi:MAG: hypothetical protein JWQ30_1103 [Sediminibacterium sp.]|nr:hypothetical protein [Sediminibacterium sp.]
MNRADGSAQPLTCLPTKAGSHNYHLSMCYNLCGLCDYVVQYYNPISAASTIYARHLKILISRVVKVLQTCGPSFPHCGSSTRSIGLNCLITYKLFPDLITIASSHESKLHRV